MKTNSPEDAWRPFPELNGRILVDEATGRIRFSRKAPLVALAATVVAIRHGETEWNAVENSWQGCVNAKRNQLTSHGVEQAERAARQLFRQINADMKLKKDIRKRFDDVIIFTSELNRARDTARIFVKYAASELKKSGIPFKPRIRVDRRLNEISFGFWDNKTLEEIERASPEEGGRARAYMRLNALVRSGSGRRRGERFIDVVGRGLDFLKSLQSPAFEDKLILIFSSAVLINALRVSFGDRSIENLEGVIDWRSYSPPHGRQSLLTEGRGGSWFGDLDSAVDRLYNEMDLTLREDIMGRFMDEFMRQMKAARSAGDASLAMERGFFSRPVSLSPGKFMGVDLGGTYLRLALSDVSRERRLDEASIGLEEFIIPDRLKTGDRYRPAKGADLFNFIAGLIEQILTASAGRNAGCAIGLTVAFPMKLDGASGGVLTESIRWIKGWSIPDLIGKDPARMLHEALAERGLAHLEIRALADDTTGTLLAGEVLDESSFGAEVVGTGMDVAIWENDKVMDVGAGRFDLASLAEMITSFDRIVDRASGAPGARLLEKMISAKYLPEILRTILCEFIHHEFLFDGYRSSVLEKPYHDLDNPQGFRAQDLSAMVLDKDRHASIQNILERAGIRESTLEERIVVRRIAELILNRSAQLSALAIAASVRSAKPDPEQEYTFTLDGNVAGRAAGYQQTMRETLDAALGAPVADRVRLRYRKFASAIGGCIMASVSSAQSAPAAKS